MQVAGVKNATTDREGNLTGVNTESSKPQRAESTAGPTYTMPSQNASDLFDFDADAHPTDMAIRV